MTSQQTRSNLYHKERRNSSESGTTSVKLVVFCACRFCGCNRRDACVGRAANTTPFGEIRPPALCGF
ncbi:hypothetical protein EIQ27_08695 [Xanthomonas campestris pv. armoraciae]